MLRLRALVLLAGLTSPLACASIYGVTTLPSDDGTDASTDATGDGRTKPKPDGSSKPDASHEGGHDAKTDTRDRDAGDGSTGHDASDGSASDSGPDTGQAFFASVTPSPITVVQSTSVNLTVNLASPAASDIQVTLSALPSGVTAPPITIGAGSTSGILTLTASASATEGLATATIASGAASKSVDVVVAGASGTLDLSFNQSGVQNITPSGGTATSNASFVVVQSDDSILIGGSDTGWHIVRLLPDGSPDTAFNANVIDNTTGAPLPANGTLGGIAVIPGTGLIVLAGLDSDTSEIELGVLLLNADGTRHQSVGSGGLYERGPDMGFHVATVGGVAVNAAGTIAVDGNTTTGAYLVTLSGTNNGTFAETNSFPAGVQIQGLVYEPNGDLVVGGDTTSEGGQLFVARFTSGLTGEGFVDGGVLGPPTTPSSSDQYLMTTQIVADPAGDIFIVGADEASDTTPAMSFVTNSGEWTLPNGYADPGPYDMGGNGYAGVASAGGGLAVVIGDGENQSGAHAFIARITSAGVLDTTFASGGVLATPVSETEVQYGAVALDSLGRIVVVGNGDLGYYATRIWP